MTFPSAVVAGVEIKSDQGAVVSVGTDLDDDDRPFTHGREDKNDHGDGDDRDRRRGPDLVIMDDFIYGEPIAISTSTPPTLAATSGTVRPVAR